MRAIIGSLGTVVRLYPSDDEMNDRHKVLIYVGRCRIHRFPSISVAAVDFRRQSLMKHLFAGVDKCRHM